MSNRLAPLLNTWFEQKDDCHWVLATIVETKGSAYRKAGAMMLFNSIGKSFGLLSGGCLESDLMRQAQRCINTNRNISVCYDMQDDADIAWQLGIGCGGLVKVLLQPINQNNNYLALHELKHLLDKRIPSTYVINLEDPKNDVLKLISKKTEQKQNILNLPISPAPALVVFGCGVDAQPLVKIAATLGWHISIIDCRAGYARAAYFKKAHQIIYDNYEKLDSHHAILHADAIVIMHHNIEFDAKALILASNSGAKYVGLLGPKHRTEKVFKQANITSNVFKNQLANPIGLDLGGELPESIALSILSQIHAKLENKKAQDLGFFNSLSVQELSSVI
ncbi:XdhC family protein [Pseudoalteromonas denitrificans]|uniref:Xanthine and CO dehydrogenase maturation factor, XdhC/CoxF family n=1 Tax=Pseudoalteromonas denitrificans DSM 6059 TaxID=1123010 RepID=A0A1I1FHN4_9GAMM|nr:XdhC/CoxI family protein [Pseudoalteromonas denitrificans]SFB96570.1 Xanthine and CO dehydrogenase maturation factor, XdhC/CoxF family [Pseudoalteromonas denitrificans DSM 6059]